MMKILLGVLFGLLILGISQSYAIVSITNTGGDCSTFGTWNQDTKTCTMNMNVNEEIDILGNWITLDGNGYSINGTGVHRSDSQVNSCIYADAKIGITIDGVKILGGCVHGIYFNELIDSKVIHSEILGNNGGGGIIVHNSDNIEIRDNYLKDVTGGMGINGFNNIIEKNTVIGKGKIEYSGGGIHIGGSENIVRDNKISNFQRTNESKPPGSVGLGIGGSGNQIINNIITENNYGISIRNTKNNHIESNKIFDNLFSGIVMGDGTYYTNDNLIEKNEIKNHLIGIEFLGRLVKNNIFEQNSIMLSKEIGVKIGQDFPNTVRNEDNVFVNNNFIDNTRQVSFGEGNFFYTEEKGGNYWDDYSLGCDDYDNNNFCDESYPFNKGTIGVVDNFVWKQKDGWIEQKSIPAITESTAEPELESEPKLPEWVRNIFIWYGEGQIGEDELIGALQFLIKQGIIKV